MQDFHSTPVACRTPNPLAGGRQTVWLRFGTFQPRHPSSQPERSCRAEQCSSAAAFFLRGVNPTGISLIDPSIIHHSLMFIMSTFVAVCAAVASASAAPSKPHILMVIVDVSCSFYTSDAYTWPALAVDHILIRVSSSLSSSLSLFLSFSLSLSLPLSVCFKGLWLGRCRVAQGNTYTGSGHADHGQPGEGRD